MMFIVFVREFSFTKHHKITEFGLLFGLLLLESGCYSADQKTYFLESPGNVLYINEGNDVKMKWNFHVESRPPSGTKIEELVFGEWATSGYVKRKILYLYGENKADKRHGYENKVDWTGNIYRCSNCSAEITMHNLTRTDFKAYGIDIVMGLHRNPLQHWLELRAPPRIMSSWPRILEARKGNTTAIKCMADGIPPPLVKIRKSDRILCNGTEQCVYTIRHTKREHQGEYECLAEQAGGKSVNQSMTLMVYSDLPSTTTTPSQPAISILLIWLLFVYVLM